jgi:UDP-N-acetylmuramyl pentapeptide phosphotransferase/UDP-N-acetylglucosamine-1-phosphate transferase
VTPAGLVRSAAAGAAGTAAAQWFFGRRPPGGAGRWARVNHRGGAVTLLEGPVVAAGLAAAALAAPGLARPVRLGAAVAALGAGAFGAYDDLAGSSDSRGFRGHLGALRRGELTSGAVKIVGIGATGLVAAALAGRRGPGVLLAGGVVAATANVVNLFDLRPGRALKAALALALLDGHRNPDAARLAAAVTGCALVVLPADLGERTMLGDAGANALGAVLGVAAVTGAAGNVRVSARLAVLTALTLASEKVSFTKIIESTPGLRDLDRVGRRPQQV